MAAVYSLLGAHCHSSGVMDEFDVRPERIIVTLEILSNQLGR